MAKMRNVMMLSGLLILVLAGASYLLETAVAQTLPLRAYLPIIVNDKTGDTGGTIAFGQIHTGIATYYDATGEGNCVFPATPNDLMVAAINSVEYENAKWCGAYVRVDGKKGSIVVRIVDQCANCYDVGHLDLSKEAFALIDDIPLGRVPISWQFVSPEMNGPIRFQFKEKNQWWTEVQVRNHRNPVDKFEFLTANGTFETVPRMSYNYFQKQNPGMGVGPHTFRVTDVFGNVIVSSGIPLSEPNVEIDGGGQFPAP